MSVPTAPMPGTSDSLSPGQAPRSPDPLAVDTVVSASQASYAAPIAAPALVGSDGRVTDALHRLLVASVVDYAIYGVTADGRVATWNTGAERLKGYTADEILGRSVSEFYPPEARGADGVAPRAVALFDEAVGAGRAEDEGWRVRRDGTRFWANVIVTPVRDAQGALLGFAKVTRDLTARRAAEMHAHELAAEQAARAAAERSEAELRVLNERLQEQAVELEAQTEEAQSLTEELEQSTEQLHQIATEAEEARDAAEHAQRIAVEAQARYRLLFEASQTARQRAEVLQSVTAALAGGESMRAVAHAALAAATQETGASAGTLALLSEDRAWFGQLAAIGFSEQALGEWVRFPSTGDYPAADVIATGTPQFLTDRLEFVARYPSREPRLQALGLEAAAILPLAGSSGVPAVGYLSLHYDRPHAFPADETSFLGALAQVTAQALERARLFQAERVARAEAEAANRSKSQFLATMSHELRTPLNAIGGYAELMELEIHGPITAEQRAALARIQRSQKHLLSLINEVLNYARLEAAAIQYDIQEVGVAGTLASVASFILPQVRAKGLRLTVGTCDPALAVRADAEKLGQVLLNLLSNAVKFTDAGEEISITCRRREGLVPPMSIDGGLSGPLPGTAEDGAFVEIAVTDTGIGIAPEELTRIFEPFVQIGRALSSPGEGTGLGLAISRELARGMGGELQVRSALGTGSTFAVTMPRIDQ
jgi:PAS domain S-box-containing protein